MKAFIFPGQGSQIVGMGKIWNDNYSEAKKIFQEVDKILCEPLSKIIFEGSEVELTKTENAQPAILTTSIAILEVIKSIKKINISKYCDFTAGHSLGEYTSLYAAGAIDLESVVKLVKYRGKLMSESDKSGNGKMVAIIGLDINHIKKLIKSFKHEGVCELANDNSNGQVVISGDMDAVNLFKEYAKKEGAKLTIDLKVSAPFHCKLMQDAAREMEKELNKIPFFDSNIPIVFNVDALSFYKSRNFPALLSKQIVNTVKWRETILFLEKKGVKKIFELGPGNVLAGLVKRITKNIECFSIQNPEDMDNLNE